MPRTPAAIAALTLSFTAASVVAQQPTKRAFTPADWYKLTTLSAPAFSPDGGRVAFTVQTVNERDNKYHREVWVVSTVCAPQGGGGGGACAPMRFTSPSTESSNPRWSADGKYLIFTSNRPGGRGATWMLRMDQPGGEAFQMETYPRGTSVPTDGRFAVWSDADTAAASDSARRADDPFAKMQPMARPPYGAITKPLDAARFDGRHIYDMRYKSNDQGFLPGGREARRWRPAQLWMQAFDGSARRRLTDTRYSHRNAVVSPDGKWIAFLADAQLRPDSVVEAERDSLAQLPYDRARDEMERNDADVFVMSVTRGAARKVVTMVGTESDITWSPDSKRIAFIGRPGRTKSARVYVASVSGGSPENLLGAWKYEPENIDWLPEGSLAMTAAIGGSSGVFRLDPTTKKLTQIVSGRRRVSGVSYDLAGRRWRTSRRISRIRRSSSSPAQMEVERRSSRASTTSSMRRSPGPTPIALPIRRLAVSRSKVGS